MPRLRALYGCMYYGMLRPSEAASLLLDECKLPGQGWGLLEFSEISSVAGWDWTDDGQVHEASRPKGGPRNAIRRVPIPPVLVTMIREHVELFGTARDGRLFRTYNGGIYLPSTLWTVLQEAREVAFTEAQQASLLAHKPYDFRHEASPGGSTRVPQHRRVGREHLEVLLRIYAHCIDGDDHRWFGSMEDALGRG